MLGEKPVIYKQLRTCIVELLAFVHEMIGSRDRKIRVHYRSVSFSSSRSTANIFFIHVQSNLSFQFDFNLSVRKWRKFRPHLIVLEFAADIFNG